MKIKTMLFLCGIVLLQSCENRQSTDFTDQVVNVVLESRTGETVEFPSLYRERIRTIPDEKEDRLILADKLEARGFKVESAQQGAAPLAGVRFVSRRLVKESCHCEVTKTYRSTAMVSEYDTSESIRCY